MLEYIPNITKYKIFQALQYSSSYSSVVVLFQWNRMEIDLIFTCKRVLRILMALVTSRRLQAAQTPDRLGLNRAFVLPATCMIYIYARKPLVAPMTSIISSCCWTSYNTEMSAGLSFVNKHHSTNQNHRLFLSSINIVISQQISQEQQCESRINGMTPGFFFLGWNG